MLSAVQVVDSASETDIRPGQDDDTRSAGNKRGSAASLDGRYPPPSDVFTISPLICSPSSMPRLAACSTATGLWKPASATRSRRSWDATYSISITGYRHRDSQRQAGRHFRGVWTGRRIHDATLRWDRLGSGYRVSADSRDGRTDFGQQRGGPRKYVPLHDSFRDRADKHDVPTDPLARARATSKPGRTWKLAGLLDADDARG